MTGRLQRQIRTAESGPALAHCLLKCASVKIRRSSVITAKWIMVLLGICLIVEISASAQILPANRTLAGSGGWGTNLVGVPGGIPYRTIIYKTETPSTSESTIQNDVNNCPSNQVVYLSAGTYNWSSIFYMANGVTMRGAGPNLTIINASANYSIQFIGYQSILYNGTGQGGSGFTRVNWTGGYTQGANVITLSSTSGLSVGQNIWVDQLNDPDTTGVGAEGATPGCYSTPAYPSDGRDRTQFQMDMVTAINGNNVTLSEPLYMPNWSSTYSPQAWWETGGIPMKYAGIEDLTVNGPGGGNSDYGIWGLGVYGCWLRNVTVTGFRYATPVQVGLRCEFRHCTIVGNDSPQTDLYGYYPKFQFGSLYIDNIGNACGSVFLIQSSAGCAFAYNYTTNCQMVSGFYLGPVYDPHGGDPNMILFEGNWGPGFGADNTWSSSAYNTGLRNRFVGASDSANAASGNVEAVDVSETCHHMSIIGNVLGTTGYNTIYEETPSTCTGSPRVYWIGGTSGCSGTNDPVAESTLINVCNWTSATSTNNGVVLNGYTVGQVPPSLIYTSPPANFGILQWPPIDPANLAYSMSRTNIPAGYRLIYGVDPPSGPVNTGPVISNISKGSLTNNSEFIKWWTTNEPATSIVNFGATAAYGFSVTNVLLVEFHNLTITGLSPGSTNHFQVLSADSSGNLATSSDGTFIFGAAYPNPQGLTNGP